MQRKKNKYKLFDDKVVNILKHKQKNTKWILGHMDFFHQKYVIVYFSLIVQLPKEK